MEQLKQLKTLYREWKTRRDRSDRIGREFKQAITQARKDGITLQAIADELGVTKGAVVYWENPRRYR